MFQWLNITMLCYYIVKQFAVIGPYSSE